MPTHLALKSQQQTLSPVIQKKRAPSGAHRSPAGIPRYLQPIKTSARHDFHEQQANQTAKGFTDAGPVANQSGLGQADSQSSSGNGSQTHPDIISDNGRSLPIAIRASFEQHLGQDFSGVRIHTDEKSAETAASLNAEAFTTGNHIVFGNGRFAPNTRSGQQLLAHELTHTVQQKNGRPGLQRKTLADAKEADRKKVSTPSSAVALTDAKVDSYFEKVGDKWGSSKTKPSGVSIELSGINKDFLTPMTSLAMELEDMTYASPVTGKQKTIFGPNLTVTVHLKLAKHGLADGNYRFAWVGNRKSGTIYIESSSGGPAPENTPTTSGSDLKVGGLTFTTLGSWKKEQLSALKEALSLTPLSALSKVDGLKFQIKSGGSSDGEDGHYEDDKHKIVIYTSAFKDSAARYGSSKWATQAIVHEIGHAIDLAPLREAWNKTPTSGTKKEMAAAAKELKKATSESGTKWGKASKTDPWEKQERLKKIDVAFRKAAQKDGVKLTKTEVTSADGSTEKLEHLTGGTTEYSNENWTELYAESFAIYVTDPETLKLIRPNIYKFFKAKFPRSKP